MITRTRSLIAVMAFCLAVGQLLAQEGQPGGQPGQPAARPPGPAPPSGVDPKYVDLSHSKDPKTKGLAERYLNLVKFQDWGGANGKTRTAKYVSHDADLRKVKLAIPQGSGKDRVLKEYDVEVAS